MNFKKVLMIIFFPQCNDVIPYSLKSNYKTGLACLVMAVVLAISLRATSIGILESYNVGACKIIPAVPTTTAIVKIHKNKRSSTIATYFQSSFTYNQRNIDIRINNPFKRNSFAHCGHFLCIKD